MLGDQSDYSVNPLPKSSSLPRLFLEFSHYLFPVENEGRKIAMVQKLLPRPSLFLQGLVYMSLS